MIYHGKSEITAILVVIFFLGIPRPSAADNRLIEEATRTRQWTGIAVSPSGRVFVNFPRWSPDVPMSVGELGEDGEVAPNRMLRIPPGKPGAHGIDG